MEIFKTIKSTSIIELLSMLDASGTIKKRYQRHKKKKSNINKILEDIELPFESKK